MKHLKVVAGAVPGASQPLPKAAIQTGGVGLTGYVYAIHILKRSFAYIYTSIGRSASHAVNAMLLPVCNTKPRFCVANQDGHTQTHARIKHDARKLWSICCAKRNSPTKLCLMGFLLLYFTCRVHSVAPPGTPVTAPQRSPSLST